MLSKQLYIICLIFILYLMLPGMYGCVKEYSYEAGPINNTIPVIDTIPIEDTIRPLISFPFCAGCSNTGDFILSTWSYKYAGSILCGSVTNAVITPERNGFTFFGPSACSADTGLVMTVFLDAEALDRDQSNITTNLVTFQYYDNTTLSDIFNSGLRSVSFTIDTYIHATGIAKGRFTGNVRTKDSTAVPIIDGKFAIQFK